MTEKNIKSRIIHKHDTAAHWSLAENFIPKQGEIIVYDIDENYTYERIKIGDGKTLVNNLPFYDENLNTLISNLLERITDLENQAIPSITIDSIDLPASGWIGTQSPYSQVVEIPGITERSQIDMQPTIEQIIELQEYGIALMITNNNSVVTVYAINGKPTTDYTIQITIMDALIRAEGVSF